MPAQNVKAGPQASSPNGLRKTIETVATVAVLVLLLKTFVAEAFVIPTGSMATTLLGAQKMATCPQCGHAFPVNCSSERESPPGQGRGPVIGCVCPNCRFQIEWTPEGASPSCASGDRLVVGKFLYDLQPNRVERQDVVVFKFPKEPLQHHEAINYIKRLIGKSGETIAIYGGDLYVYPGAEGSRANLSLIRTVRARPGLKNCGRKSTCTRTTRRPLLCSGKESSRSSGNRRTKSWLSAGWFTTTTTRRKIWHRRCFPPRWAPERAAPSGVKSVVDPWVSDDAHGFRHPARQGDLAWLRYRHLVIQRSTETKLDAAARAESKPELITDFMGYNAWLGSTHSPPGPNWVGDLMLECEANVESAGGQQSGGQLVLELSKGVDRFQARWDLASGQCTLVRVTASKEEQLESKPTSLRPGGSHLLRFANVDQKLLVWVDRDLPFGEGVAYAPPQEDGPFRNDLQPASIGARGDAIRIRKLKLWRDTYYTVKPGSADVPLAAEDWSNPDRWQALRELPMKTLYIQPGHYLCLGDNSPESSDGRSWGLVPQRLLLGRALVVYYPFWRIGPIH